MESDSSIGFFLNVNPQVIIAGLFYADWLAAPPAAFDAFAQLKSYWGPFIPTTNGTIASLTSAINIGDFPAKYVCFFSLPIIPDSLRTTPGLKMFFMRRPTSP